jgi:hypothetical protein
VFVLLTRHTIALKNRHFRLVSTLTLRSGLVIAGITGGGHQPGGDHTFVGLHCTPLLWQGEKQRGTKESIAKIVLPRVHISSFPAHLVSFRSFGAGLHLAIITPKNRIESNPIESVISGRIHS